MIDYDPQSIQNDFEKSAAGTFLFESDDPILIRIQIGLL